MEITALKTYGANLGKAFQMQDDLLDYLGDPAKTGKTVGNDFCEGKMTLPLLHALDKADRTEYDFLLGLLKGMKNERVANLEEAREIIRKNSGFEYTRNLAEKLINNAVASLSFFAAARDKPALETLVGLARFVVTREK
jgi:octaprenyl-diphosphate synthase